MMLLMCVLTVAALRKSSEAMAAFKVKELEVSPWALREGVLLRYLDHLS